MSEQPTYPILTFTISQEELAVMLKLLNISQLPGFKPPSQLATLANEVAQRGLLSRGFIQPDGDEISLDETITAIVACGAIAQQAVNVTHADPTGSRESGWFYLVPDLTVFHNTPFPGVHHFETIPNGTAFLRVMAAAMRLDGRDETKSDGQPFVIQKTAWDQTLPAILSGDKNTIRRVLTQTNAPSSFVENVINTRAFNVITTMETTQQNTLEADALLVLVGALGYYVIRPGNTPDALHITPTDVIGALDAIAEQIRQPVQ